MHLMKDEKIHRSPKIVEYWETQKLPRMHKTSQEFRNALVCLYTSESLNTLFQEPFLSPEEIERKQFLRIRQLVELDYNNIPLYRNKYQEVGFELGDLKSWEDYHCLPVVTKELLKMNLFYQKKLEKN